MSLAGDIQDTVVTLLNDPEYSRACTLRRTTTGNYDTATGTIVKTVADSATRCLLMNYSDYFINGETIKRGDRRALLKGDLDPEPKTGDRLVIATVTYEIMDVQKIELAGTNIVFAMQIRAGG